MIITIDTSKDGKEDIEAAIAALQRLLGKRVADTPEISEESTQAFGSIFGDDSPPAPDDDKPEGKPSIEMY